MADPATAKQVLVGHTPREHGGRATRRQALVAAGALALGSARAAAPPVGWVRPRLAPPELALTGHDGRARPLAALLAGKVTAVQLMFTGCSTTCPPQGALFAAVAARLPPAGFQLLSISIDALGDSPDALSAWLQKFGRSAPWSAAVPSPADADRVARFLKGTASGADAHTAQVFVADRQGRLCYRTGDAPDVPFVTALLAHVAAGGD